MEIFLLEYSEEIKYDEFDAEKYSLIGVYYTENEALRAKDKFALMMNISNELLFVSATKVGRVQWEGGFVTV